MAIQDIKREIEMLSPRELQELQVWLSQREQEEARVELGLKAAVDSGKFDRLIEEAIADEKAGLTTPL